MAAVDEEEDGYSDDDLDALPVDALQKLQQDAYITTQQTNAIGSNVSYWTGRETRSGIVKGLGAASNQQNYAYAGNIPLQPSSDYGDLDDEMLDGEILNVADQPTVITRNDGSVVARPAGESTQREQWRQQLYAAHMPSHNNKQPSQPAIHANALNTNAQSSLQENNLHDVDDMLLDDETYTDEPRRPDQNVDILQAKVQELLRERELLQQAAQAAESRALAKTGEIAIVRANQIKTEKEYERRLAAMQKMHADEAARQKIEVDSARAERQRIETENQFLKHDAQDIRRTRIISTDAKDAAKIDGALDDANGSPLTTPKKSRVKPFGDGFEDDETIMLSPSKLAIRSKVGTPKAGAKRKRKQKEDSPVPKLRLSQSKDNNRIDDFDQDSLEIPNPPPDVSTAVAVPVRPQQENDRRFEFTQSVLNHRINHDQERSFEALAAFAFPSNSEKPLSSVILDRIALLGVKREIEDFPAAICQIIISLWSQCIAESFFQPLHLLMDLVKFILLTSPLGTPRHLVDDIVPLAQITADVNVIPRFQRFQPQHKAIPELKAEIDTYECLQVLHLVAYGCVGLKRDNSDDIIRFWKHMRFDFILMILNINQPLGEIRLMLDILHTSIFKDSFAMVVAPGNGDQKISEGHVVDRLTVLLTQNPKTVEGEESVDVVEMADLRSEVLDLMDQMADTDHGGEALSNSPFAIGRLVRCMSDELDFLYNYQYGFENRIPLINTSTRLLHHLTTTYPHLINLSEKLRVVPGGTQKHLIALTRLAFSESIWYEEGIEDEVVDCAHQMLEACVTPEEAEGLSEAFGSARG